MAGLFTSLIPGAVTAAAGVGMAKDMTQLGEDVNKQLGTLGETVQSDMAFNPYSVKTGLATSEVDAMGGINLGVGGGDWGRGQWGNGVGDLNQAASMAQDGASNAQLGGALNKLNAAQQGIYGQQQQAYDASSQMMNASLQSPEARQQSLFEQMQAAQQPALQRARSAMEARAQAQGRSGIRGNQYGGSSEQHAQSMAEAEARNNAMLQAGTLARQEQMQQGQLASQYGQLGQGYTGQAQNAAQLQNQFGVQQAQLGQGAAGTLGNIGNMLAGQGLAGYQASFLPMQHQMQAMGLGAQNANLAQTGQISGSNMLAQLGLGGVQANVNANKAATELYGNMFGALATPLTGLGTKIDEEGLSGLWDDLTGIWGGNA